MNMWELIVSHKDYNKNNIKNIEIYTIEEENIPIEFTDIIAKQEHFENDDFTKPIKTVIYFKNGIRLFAMMDSILQELNGNIPVEIEAMNFDDLEIDFKALRLNLRNEYPEYIV